MAKCVERKERKHNANVLFELRLDQVPATQKSDFFF